MTENLLQKEAAPYFDELYNLSLRLTCSFRKAEKMILHVIKEAMIFYEYHEPTDVRKWLLRISLNLYERFYSVNKTDQDSFIDNEFDKCNSYIDQVDFREAFKQLSEKEINTLFKELPSNLRISLVLKEVLTMDYSLIAELTDIPPGTVAARISRARKFIFIKLSGITSDD